MMEKVCLILISCLYGILALEILYFIPWISYLLNNVYSSLLRAGTQRNRKRSCCIAQEFVCLFFCLILIKKHTCLRIFGEKKPQNVYVPRDSLKSQLFTVEQTCRPATRFDARAWWRQLEGWKVAVWWSTGDVGLCVTLGLGTGRCYWRLVLAGRGVECVRDSTAFAAATWHESWF